MTTPVASYFLSASNSLSSFTRCCVKNWSFKCTTGISKMYLSANSFGHSGLWMSTTDNWNGYYRKNAMSPISTINIAIKWHTCFCTFRIASLAVVHKEQVLEENRVNVIARDAMIRSLVEDSSDAISEHRRCVLQLDFNSPPNRHVNKGYAHKALFDFWSIQEDGKGWDANKYRMVSSTASSSLQWDIGYRDMYKVDW